MPDFTPRKALDLIEDMRSGRIQVPTFQRDFVWKRQDVEKLLDSIRREIPLGTITLWEPGQGHRTELFEPFFKSVKVKKWSGDEEHIEPESDDNDSNWFFSFTEQTGLPQPREITGPVYGVIDGRQRLTTLMMLFGGITFSTATHKHGGLWVLKLDADLVKDDAPFTFLTWKESKEYASIADWVKAGFFPLWLHSKRDDFVDALDNSNNFESQAQHITARKKWRRNLNMFCDIVSSLSVAAYILDAKVDLEKVCVIFETLNTRGVRVGVYDIVQARLMGMPLPAPSTERYDLKRNVRQVYEASSAQYLGRWFNENDGQGDVIVCHAAMSHRMGLTLGLGNKWEAFSFKGNDLIYQTNIEDYLACLDGTPPKLESFAKDFDAVTNGVDSRAVCPYPILFAQYCALRWAQATTKDKDPTLICTINDAFRVFFWRSCLTNRYDQGYLTRSVSDLKTLWQFVSSKDNLQRYNDNRSSWWHDYGALLKTKKDGLDLDKPSKDDLVASIKDGSSGALQKALTVLLYSQKPKDLKTGASLSGVSRPDVELHHIFPVKWVQKNRSKFRNLLDGPAALVPLSEDSNQEWLDTNPHQQIMKWGLQMSPTCPIDWDTWRGRMESLLISEYAFKQLISQSADNVERFIHDRTDALWRACDELCTTKSS